MAEFFKKKTIIIIIAIAVISVAVATVFILKSNKSEKVTYGTETQATQTNLTTTEKVPVDNIDFSGITAIEALSFDSTGVAYSSDFKIITDRPYEIAVLNSGLKTIPVLDFNVNKQNDNEYILEFHEELKPDMVYTIGYAGTQKNDMSWAFQTKKSFHILRSLPADKSSMVPVNSGIEITFTHSGIKNIAEHFEINPQVTGTFEYHKNVVVFVPEALDYDTVYNVKVTKGIELEGSNEKTQEDYQFSFQTQNEEDYSGDYHYISFSDYMYNFTGEDVPVLELYADEYYSQKLFYIDVFRYEGADSFINDLYRYNDIPYWAYRSSDSMKFEFEDMQKHTSFSTNINNVEEPWYKQMLVFPETLENGHYLVRILCDDKVFFLHIQVSDLSVYAMFANEKSIIWVNEPQTGNPVSNIKIEGKNLSPVYTGEDGICKFNTPIDKDDVIYCLKLTEEDGSQYAAVIQQNNYPWYYGYNYYDDGLAGKEYWSYLYLDRGMYLTSDIISVWGLVRPRNGAQRSSTAKISLNRYCYSGQYADDTIALIEREVPLTQYGTFSASLDFQNFNPGSYYITVTYQDETIARRYIDISRYTKPAYKITATTEKELYRLNEDVKVDIEASFFEGSPVSGLDVEYSSYSYSYSYEYASLNEIKGVIKCDSNGKASLKFVPGISSQSDEISWNPINMNMYFRNLNPEEQQVEDYKSIYVFPRDTMITAEAKAENGSFDISISTNIIDLEKKGEFSYYDNEKYRGEAVDKQLKAMVYEEYWDKTETGEYYDFINKVTRKTYDYFQVTNQVHEFEVSTVDGKAQYSFSLENYSSDRSYYVLITGTDSKGKKIKEKIYIFFSYYYPENNEENVTYTLIDKDGKTSYGSNERLTVNLQENYQDFTLSDSGKVLYIILRNGLLEYKVMGESSFDTIFKEEYIPNAYVKAVYYDGQKLHDAGLWDLHFRYKDKELNVLVTPEKTEYQPGDIVNIEFEVKDSKGNPTDAEVNFSVVDEAFFALLEQHLFTLGDIYSYSFDTGIMTDYYSKSDQESKYPFAENGEGGDSVNARFDFRDNAFFGNTITGSDGKGSVSFKLPDNTTSWRITWQAVNNDLEAAGGTLNVTAGIPFFVNTVFNDVFFEEDEPSIALRSFGTAVSEDTRVDYKITLEGPYDYKEVFERTGKASEYTNISLVPFNVGNYSMTVDASSGEYKDMVKKNFKVKANILEALNIECFDLAENTSVMKSIDLSTSNKLINLSFYNKDISLYYRTLSNLCYSFGERIDQKLSRMISSKHMKKYFDIDYSYEDVSDYSKWQTNNGGITLLTYDNPDPELSAKVCSLYRDGFDRLALIEYFYTIINSKENTMKETAAAYWGLASFREPVLISLNEFIKDPDIDLTGRLYSALAFAELGDTVGAQKIYNEIIQNLAKSTHPYVYINSGDHDDIIQYTSLMAILAMKLDTPDMEGLFRYTAENSADEVLLNLEKLHYIVNILPGSDMNSTFTYAIDGNEKTVELKGIERYSITVTPEKLNEMKFKDINGQVELSASYMANFSEFEGNDDKIIKISRKYLVNGKETKTLKRSDLVTVVLDIEFDQAAPEGYYIITDVIPSGMNYVPPGYESPRWNFYEDVNGQIITMGYYYSRDGIEKDTLSYTTRIRLMGEFGADYSIIRHYKSNILGIGSRSKIKIE